jgi:hypothetical protein
MSAMSFHGRSPRLEDWASLIDPPLTRGLAELWEYWMAADIA